MMKIITLLKCPLGHYIPMVSKILPKGVVFVKKSYKNFIINVLVTSAIILIPAVVEAAIGIEAGGRRIHGTLVGVGKWVIIIKGSIDCIQSVLNGDVAKAKQQFFGYLLCFGIMLALPWALDEVEGIFK